MRNAPGRPPPHGNAASRSVAVTVAVAVWSASPLRSIRADAPSHAPAVGAVGYEHAMEQRDEAIEDDDDIWPPEEGLVPVVVGCGRG